ncbi:hypothetical protein PTSG_12079 [Rhizophagus irregularis DAOM 181602=DAOM 197198]|nr:hypothetical protein PTSG_12079 [Rhizophagus irregularis DAOM 181602=DAOM 197198]
MCCNFDVILISNRCRRITPSFSKEFVIVYLDDIMIYLKDFEEYIEYIDKVLNKLRENNLIVKLKKSKPLYHLVKKDVPFKWTEKQQEAFEELKIKLMEKPVLDYPNFEKEFILITDASEEGLGAVLSQKNEENKEFVIAYASRSLVGVEKNYPITELECLAIFWGIKHFHKFLAL